MESRRMHRLRDETMKKKKVLAMACDLVPRPTGLLAVFLASSVQIAAASSNVPAPGAAIAERVESVPAFPALPGILESYRHLSPGDAFDAGGKEFRIGHLHITFRSGTLY